MTDTHSHPYMAETPALAIESMRRAISNGVDRIIMPNTDVSTIQPMKDLAAAFPGNIRLAIGLHPTEVKESADEDLSVIMAELDNNPDKYVAIGEIGLDFYWDRSFEKKQIEIFDLQVAKAVQQNLPVIIHCREALDETLEVLKGHKNVRGVFHSFGGTPEDIAKISRVGDFYFGINGIVTFKNSKLKDALSSIPADRLLLETDSPYLAPVPKRGKPNESAYLPYIAQFIADSLGKPLSTLIEETSQNSERLFGF